MHKPSRLQAADTLDSAICIHFLLGEFTSSVMLQRNAVSFRVHTTSHPFTSGSKCRQSRRIKHCKVYMASQQNIQFWSSKVCPYAQRSWMTLLEKGIDFEFKTVDLQNKSPEFVELYQSVHPVPNATAKVPLLVDGETTLVESNVVSEFLDRKFPGKGPQLFPSDPKELALVQWWVTIFSEQFQPALFAMLGADSQEKIQEAKGKVEAALQILDRFIAQFGQSSGPFFFGERYSYVEVVSTPFLQRAVVGLRFHRGYDIEKAISKHERLAKWLKASLDRPSHKQTEPSAESIEQGWGRFVKFQGKVHED